MQTLEREWKSMYKIGAIAAFVQAISMVLTALLPMIFGSKPATEVDYFTFMQSNKIIGLLRDEFGVFLLISLYLITFYAVYGVLKQSSPVFAKLSYILIVVGVVCFFAAHPGFSMLHLSDQYSKAITDIEKNQIIAAGKAILASNYWNSTSGYMVGILLQGGGILMSVIMLRNKSFFRITGISGIIANGLDLTQHIVHPFLPGITQPIIMFMGIFYFIWYPTMSWSLFKIGKAKVQQV